MSTATAGPVDIITELSPEGEVDAVLAVRWLLPQASVDTLKANGAEGVHVLLIALHEGFERRWLVPVEREMTYVQFDRPGAWHLDATLVWNRSGSRKHLRELLAPSGPGHYVFGLYDHLGNHGWWRNGIAFLGTDNALLDAPSRLDVVVAERFFAKEPHPIVLKFARLGSPGSKPVDQCDLRRRLIGSSLLSLMIAAIAFLLVASVVIVVHSLSGSLWPWMELHGKWLLIGIGSVLAICAVLALSVAIPKGFGALRRTPALRRLGAWWRAQNAAADARFQARKARERARARQEYLELMEQLARDQRREARLSALDPSKRTLYLRFRALKAKVCRPYAAR